MITINSLIIYDGYKSYTGELIIFYYFLKFFLGSLGFFSLILLFIFCFLLVKIIFFNNFIITINELLNYDLACPSVNTEKTLDEKCKSIITIYWLIVVSFILFIFSLVTLYPYFKMKKKKI